MKSTRDRNYGELLNCVEVFYIFISLTISWQFKLPVHQQHIFFLRATAFFLYSCFPSAVQMKPFSLTIFCFISNVIVITDRTEESGIQPGTVAGIICGILLLVIVSVLVVGYR